VTANSKAGVISDLSALSLEIEGFIKAEPE
jgi:hypothetical protein